MTRNTIKRPAWTCLSGAAPRPLALVLAVAILALLLFQGGVRAQGTFDPAVDAQLSDYTCDVNADVTTSFSLTVTDYNYKELVSFTPAEFFVAAEGDVPLGGVAGQLDYLITLGLLNGPCNTPVAPHFDLFWASTDTSNLCTYEEQFANSPIAGLQNGIHCYPDFLTRIMPGITPRARLYGYVNLSGSDLTINLVILEPGTLGYPPAWGYPSVSVLMDMGDPGPLPTPDPITDFCTPRSEDSVMYGLSQDNPATGDDEAGYEVRSNPAWGGTYTFRWHAESYRDADGDGIENPQDTCPFDSNVDPPPNQPTGHPDNDGIDSACDPDPTFPCWPGAPGPLMDCDDDGFTNRGDNCPLVANPDQADADADDIGDACDLVGAGGIGQGPDTPDGDPIELTLWEAVDIICAPPPSPTPTPPPGVGGMVEMQVGGSSSAVGSVADSSGGSSSRNYIAIVGLAAPAVVILIVAASYARRRWLR